MSKVYDKIYGRSINSTNISNPIKLSKYVYVSILFEIVNDKKHWLLPKLKSRALIFLQKL